jgi:hypothetical protein
VRLSGRDRRERHEQTLYGRTALRALLAEIADTDRRTDTTFRAACRVGELVASGDLDRIDAERKLLDAAADRGLRHRDAERQVLRGVERGLANAGGRRLVEDATHARVQVSAWWVDVTNTVTDSTMLAILRVIRDDMLHVGKVECSLSSREIAEQAGVDRSTVTRRMDNIRAWVQVRTPSRKQQKRTTFRLPATPPHHSGATPKTDSGVGRNGASTSQRIDGGLVHGCRTPLDDPSIDFWTGRRHLWSAWGFLDDEEPVTAREFGMRIGRTVRTAQRTLAALQTIGLARSDGDGGWCRQTPTDVEITTDRRDQRKERHRMERKVFTGYVAAYEVAGEDELPSEEDVIDLLLKTFAAVVVEEIAA